MNAQGLARYWRKRLGARGRGLRAQQSSASRSAASNAPGRGARSSRNCSAASSSRPGLREDVAADVPQAQRVVLGDVLAGLRPPQERERLGEPALRRPGPRRPRSPPRPSLRSRPAGRGAPPRPAARPPSLAQPAERVGDQVVLVDTPRHALVRLELGDRLLPPARAVVGQAEDLADARGSRGERLGLLRLRRRPPSGRRAPAARSRGRARDEHVALQRRLRARGGSPRRPRAAASATFDGVPCGRAAGARLQRAWACGERTRREREQAARRGRPVRRCSGSDLLSHPVARAVPSALEGFTSGFGMGPGVSPPPWPPKPRCPRRTLARVRPRAELENYDSEREQEESSPRAISTGQLHTLPCFHFPPIDLVVFQGPYLVSQWEASSPGELRT